MQNIDWNKHYNIFKWAVAKNWKDKNGLHRSIQGKIETLVQEYDLSEKDIVDDLFEDYWERGHYRKYDEAKGSLNNWIAHYVDLYLNHFIRRYSVRPGDNQDQRIDPLDRRNWSNLDWIDIDNEREDPDYQPEILIDPTNPEDLLIAKETLEFARNHFSETEIAYLTGEMDLAEVSEISGISCKSFKKRLNRRKADFVTAMKTIESGK